MEGHRFAVEPIAAGEAVLSWELPFGYAIAQPSKPVNMSAKQGMFEALESAQSRLRSARQAQFRRKDRTLSTGCSQFSTSQAGRTPRPRATFQGYLRSDGRGVGTRNTIVLIGTSSRTAGFVRQLEAS